ncbi:hypothetical protein ACJX0J_012451, partial [Zea mays]
VCICFIVCFESLSLCSWITERISIILCNSCFISFIMNLYHGSFHGSFFADMLFMCGLFLSLASRFMVVFSLCFADIRQTHFIYFDIILDEVKMDNFVHLEFTYLFNLMHIYALTIDGL